MKVVKFGGSLFVLGVQFEKVFYIVILDLVWKVVVVLVLGKCYVEDMKVIDFLIVCVE